MNHEVLLKDPKPVIEEPMPRPETPRQNKTEQATTDREARNRSLRDKVLLENEERKERGPKVGHNVFYNEVQKRIASRLFLALGTEGKRRFVKKNSHIEVSKLECRELVALAKIAFEKTKSITYKRYKLFARTQKSGKAPESFHAALTAQEAKAGLGTLEDELVRNLFISRMKNAALQDSLTFEFFSPIEVLKKSDKV